MKLEEAKFNKQKFPLDKIPLSLARYVNEVTNPKIYCKFCGRVLKNAKSKQNGFGQGCYERWVKSRSNKRSLV